MRHCLRDKEDTSKVPDVVHEQTMESSRRILFCPRKEHLLALRRSRGRILFIVVVQDERENCSEGFTVARIDTQTKVTLVSWLKEIAQIGISKEESDFVWTDISENAISSWS